MGYDKRNALIILVKEFRRIKMEEYKTFCHSEDAEEKPAGEGTTRKILSYSDNLMVCEMHFDKGAVGALHTHPHEQITYIISGEFESTVDGKTSILKAGDTVYSKGGAVHGLKCIEEGLLLDIFTPKRDDFLK